MEKVLDMFHSDYFFLPPARSVGGLFLNIYCENLFSFLEVKLMRVESPSDLVPRNFLLSY